MFTLCTAHHKIQIIDSQTSSFFFTRTHKETRPHNHGKRHAKSMGYFLNSPKILRKRDLGVRRLPHSHPRSTLFYILFTLHCPEVRWGHLIQVCMTIGRHTSCMFPVQQVYLSEEKKSNEPNDCYYLFYLCVAKTPPRGCNVVTTYSASLSGCSCRNCVDELCVTF